MKLLSSFVSSVLFAANSRTTWFIDGNNLMGHKGTPRDPQTIADKLKPIEQASSDLSVILVWDGRAGKDTVSVEPSSNGESSSVNGSILQVVSLAEGMSTDDYILEQLQQMKKSEFAASSSVMVVTADRAFRRQILESKPMVSGVVNPLVFWKRYRPRLSGMKSDYRNQPKKENAQ
mmetsp:Transcript_19665/g.25337  ORF Transcript_19665/g.25337 Transcript_19665/m.25337 type:complete len:176 (-) Transcript_19665:185-712(-)